MAERVRIEIGFDGGQVMVALVDVEAVQQLEERLSGAGEGAVSLEAEDGRYIVPLRRIVYVKRFAREARVGFGSP